MGRIVSFDLDRVIATIQRVGPDIPGVLAMIGTKVPQAAGLQAYAEMLPALAEMAGKLAGPAGGKALPGLPPIPGARMRGQYLKQSLRWSDDQVCRAAELVISQAQGAPEIVKAVEYTSRISFGPPPLNAEGKAEYTDAQTRAAIDSLLDSEDSPLGEDVADQFGGHIFYVLTHRKG